MDIQPVDLETIRSWGAEGKFLGGEEGGGDTVGPIGYDDLKFAVKPSVNDRVYLWEGRIYRLRVDAVLNTTNESMNDRTGISGQIHQAAGPQLVEEISITEGCRTGECRITRAYLMPAKRIIHTVGPRYNEKYRTAAESALHYCYRNTLELLLENNLSSVALCVVNTERKGYPREAAVHIALRTVRRFMESHPGLTVVFCCETTVDRDIYARLMRMYFPRGAADIDIQRRDLPEDVGNERGEPVVEDRQVRIGAMPGVSGDEIPSVGSEQQQQQQQQQQQGAAERRPEVPDTLADTDSFMSFQSMRSAPDEERRRARMMANNKDPLGDWADAAESWLTGGGGVTSGGGSATASRQGEDAKYAKWLSQALCTDLTSMQRLSFLYKAGVDKSGRNVFVLNGSCFPARDVDDDLPLLYIISIMDAHVHLPYTLVYVNSNFSLVNNQPLPAWFSMAHDALDRRYKKNLKSLLVLHPSMAGRTVLLGLRALFSPKFWKKVSYCDTVSDLYRDVRKEEIPLPESVEEYEREQQNSLMNSILPW